MTFNDGYGGPPKSSGSYNDSQPAEYYSIEVTNYKALYSIYMLSILIFSVIGR